MHGLAPGEVRAGALTVRAPRMVICPGPAYADLPLSLRDGLTDLTLCKLQMLRIAPPAGRRYAPALMTGLSTIRYPAFTAQPGCDRVRERLTAERPELVAAGIHLIVTQLPHGDLIIGDTHDYGDTPTPFREERLDGLLLAEARRLLGADALEVRERWIGVYPSAPGRHFVVSVPFEGARVVEVTSGLGMTMALGHAATVLDEIG